MALDQLTQFMQAISSQESSGNPTAQNSRTQAYGLFQILPSNWPSWSREAGLGPNAPRTAANQTIVAKHKMSQYYRQFGSWEAVAVAWFAGPSRAQRYVNGDMSVLQLSDGNMTVGGYISKMRQGMATASGKSGWEATQVAQGTMPTTPEGVTAASAPPPDESGALLTTVLQSMSDKVRASEGGVIGEDEEDDDLADIEVMSSMDQYLNPVDPMQPGTAADPTSVGTAAVTGAAGGMAPNGKWGAKSVGEWAKTIAPAFGLQVTSHVRDPEHNARVGGAPNSDHLWGGGIDFAGTPEQMAQFANWAKKYTGDNGPFRIVLYGDKGHRDHVHVSFNRGSNKPAPTYSARRAA